MSCRFPGGADTPEKFWELLDKGIDPVRDIPESRWRNDSLAHKDITTRKGAYLDDVEQFDSLFFGISPKEAQAMDPQQRLLLELHWEALEDAGWDPTSLAGQRAGVFVGISGSDYAQVGRDLGHSPGPYTFTGTLLNTAAGRISYVFGLKGPAMAIDTACSSSLVAVHQGMLQLRSGGCDVALASGVNLILRAEAHVGTTSLGAMSASERCRSFDNAADGYIRSEGSAVLVLKRLVDAERDGDDLWGVIRGGAVNHDGHSGGLTVPNGLSQQEVIRQALSDGGLKPEDIDYVEAHGSATKIGDPQEVSALAKVFNETKQSVYLGSVKSNLGHLEAAAGMAGLCKVLLSMSHGRIPANLHFQKGNALIKWDNNPFKVVQEPTEWKARQGMRRAGISAFGISGTNAHLVIESAPRRNKSSASLNETDAHLCTISAQSENALRQYVKDLADWCHQPTTEIAELCRNLNQGRASLNHRLALTVNDLDALEKRLGKLADSSETLGVEVAEQQKPLVFLFTGQGSHYHNMARSLYEQSPVFRNKFDELDAMFEAKIGKSLAQLIYGPQTEEIQRPLYAQPLIFSIQMALAHFWESLGVLPNQLIGHSIGEYSAACLDGVIGMEDAIHMVSARAYIMDETPVEGRMVGVLANESKVREMIGKYDDVSIAAINSPENVTVSGKKSSMDDFVSRARKKRLFVEELSVSHPFHSVLMKDRAQKLKKEIEKVTFHKPSHRFISTVYGGYIPEDVTLDADYWASHLVEPVQFSDALETAVSQGGSVFLEIGGTATLCGLAAQNNVGGKDLLFLPSLRKNRSTWRQLYTSLGQLWESGYPIQWKALYKGDLARIENLPHTPYEPKKFWHADIRVLNQSFHGMVTTPESNMEQPTDNSRGKMDTHSGKESEIQESLKKMVEDIVEVHSEDITNSMNLFRLGLDSLMLVQFSEKIMRQYRLDIPIKMYFADLNTVNDLSKYIHENRSDSVNAPMQVLEVGGEASTSSLSSVLEKMDRRLIRIEERLSILDSSDETSLRIDKNGGELNRHDDHFGLTSDEQRVYFLSKLEGGNLANQLYQVFRLNSRIDIEKLKNAFQKISDKHEMLRSSFHIKGSDVTHYIANNMEPTYAVIDLRREDGAATFKDFFESPFDLSKPPLWRWGVVQDDQGYKLIINAHHTIADGYALNLIWSDLSDLLNGVRLKEVPKHYRDFVEKEQAFLNSEESGKQREWWLKQFTPLPESLDLPSDISRPEINRFGGSVSKFTLDADMSSAIKTLAKENNATPFMGLMAAWTAFLGKLSNQTDFCVAIPSNRRNVGDFKNNVGMFTQTIILRLNPNTSMSFIDYLQSTKDTFLDAYSYGDYPFDMLMEELQLPRDMSRNPLFDVMVNYNTVEQKNIQFGDVQGVRDEIQLRHAQFDLFLDVLESDDQFICRLNYAKPLFSEERIDDWIHRFLRFLNEIIKEPAAPFAEIGLTHGKEQTLLSMGRGKKDHNDKTTVNKLLSDVFKNKSTESAVWFQEKEMSYNELGLRTRMLANHLVKLGVRPGDKIGILLSRTPDMVASMLAAIKVGCVFVPLDASFPKERLSYMMEDSGMKQLISEASIMEYYGFSLPYLDPTTIEMIDRAGDVEDPIVNNAIKPNDIAYIIYTSGSTGKPKGVEIEHGSLANFTVGMAKALDWPHGARTACFTTSSFDIYLLETLLCLVHGGCVVLSHDEVANPAEMAHIVTKGAVECLQMTPTRLKLLCADSKMADNVLTSVNVLIVGGEVFPMHLLPFLQRYRSLRIFNVYGPTETCVWSTCKEVTTTDTINIGLPIANTDVYVLDNNKRLVSPGVIGDLWIGGAGVARGYHNKPELTAERFVEDPLSGGRMYCTGDRAMWKDGELVSLGREDEQVKLRGFRIELGEIEEVLREHPAIINGAAAVQELSPVNHVLVAYFQKHQEEMVTESDIKDWLRERLPEYMVADYIVELPSIPQTLNGKINRKRLLSPNVKIREQSTENVYEGMDDTLLTIWKKVLGDKEIGLNESFFDIGGKSFSLVLVHNELEKTFPGVVSVADLFALPTISKLKEYIEGAVGDNKHGNEEKFTLPATWFDGLSTGGGRVEAQLESRASNAVKDLGKDYGLDFTDTLFGLFALYLNKSLGLNEIPLWTFGYIERAACVQFDFQRHSDLSHIFRELSASFPTQKDFHMIDSLDLIMGSDGNVRVGFVNGDDMDSRKLLRRFDFYLVVYEEKDQITLTFHYGKRIAENAIKIQLKQFIKMVSLVVEKTGRLSIGEKV